MARNKIVDAIEGGARARDLMTMKDVRRLQGDASSETHLVRFDRAHARRNVDSVLDVDCPYCGALAHHPCASARRS
jgi:hypothetical protein